MGGKTTVKQRTLAQAENAATINLAYKPVPDYASFAARLADEGLLSRRQTGGFDLTDAGRRELARLRGRK